MAGDQKEREVLDLILNVENLGQWYGSNKVLNDLSFQVESGEVVALLGPNGSGKSTLIKTMCHIYPPKSGRVTVDGRDVAEMDAAERARLIGYVPQTVQYAPFTTVLDTVLVGRRPYVQWSYSENDLRIAAEALDTMNILNLRDRYINELSGGQRQRVFIARALAQHPHFYMFDEPTSSLDLRYQLKTMRVMRDIVRQDGCAMVVAMHDLNLALRYSDKVLMLKTRDSCSYGCPDDVINPGSILEVYEVRSNIVINEQGAFILPFE